MVEFRDVILGEDVAEGLYIVQELCGDNFILVGAAARDIILEKHGLSPERATRDADLAIRIKNWEIYAELRLKLIKKGFQQTRTQYNFTFKRAIFDIIPFGEIATEKSEILWPQDGKVMNMLGFEEAFNTSPRFTTKKNLKVRIASLASLVMLKTIAWKDRPRERTQDPLDIRTIISNYLDAGNFERFYDEHSDLVDMEPYTIERGGAALLGRDLLLLCSKDTLARVTSILKAELDNSQNSLFFRQMSTSDADPLHVELIQILLKETAKSRV
ncbi:MAG: hypothetical protein EOP04_03920 [Proteobacteria bacterium]|nr:MAG: hypothetical protein EOP04_03920 [Pseudomonadota bacterium]